jgi:hypothetical protein
MLDDDSGICAHAAERRGSDVALPHQAHIAEAWHARAQALALEHGPRCIHGAERTEVAQVWPIPCRKDDGIDDFPAAIAPDHTIIRKVTK